MTFRSSHFTIPLSSHLEQFAYPGHLSCQLLTDCTSVPGQTGDPQTVTPSAAAPAAAMTARPIFSIPRGDAVAGRLADLEMSVLEGLHSGCDLGIGMVRSCGRMPFGEHGERNTIHTGQRDIVISTAGLHPSDGR